MRKKEYKGSIFANRAKLHHQAMILKKHPMNVNVNTRMRWEAIRRIPELVGVSGKKILDIAAGLGFFGVQLTSLGANVMSVDIHSESLEYLKKNYNLDVLLADVETDSLNELKDFDVVLLCEVLEHLKNHAGAVGKAVSCLKDGGLIVITTPALEGPLINTPGKDMGHDGGSERHERRGFLRTELEDIAEKSGITIKGHSYCVYYTAEIFMQLTKLMYLLKRKSYDGQGDVTKTMNSLSYKLLKLIYPIMHPLFLLEEKILRALGFRGNCHVIWGTKDNA